MKSKMRRKEERKKNKRREERRTTKIRRHQFPRRRYHRYNHWHHYHSRRCRCRHLQTNLHKNQTAMKQNKRRKRTQLKRWEKKRRERKERIRKRENFRRRRRRRYYHHHKRRRQRYHVADAAKADREVVSSMLAASILEALHIQFTSPQSPNLGLLPTKETTPSTTGHPYNHPSMNSTILYYSIYPSFFMQTNMLSVYTRGHMYNTLTCTQKQRSHELVRTQTHAQ